MNDVAKHERELTTEERILIGDGHKNVITPLIDSWKILLKKMEEFRGNMEKISQIKEYKKDLKKMIHTICTDALKGDWNRYFAEITIHGRKTFMDEAESAYKMVATRIDEVKLPSFDPLRLRLQLSHAIFNYDILNEHSVAHDIAVKARDDSNGELGGLSREAHSESYNMLEAIQNQLIKWDFQ
ncbi:hypothetical protein ACS0TY_000786 [Phlomoides rotata]